MHAAASKNDTISPSWSSLQTSGAKWTDCKESLGFYFTLFVPKRLGFKRLSVHFLGDTLVYTFYQICLSLCLVWGGERGRQRGCYNRAWIQPTRLGHPACLPPFSIRWGGGRTVPSVRRGLLPLILSRCIYLHRWARRGRSRKILLPPRKGKDRKRKKTAPLSLSLSSPDWDRSRRGVIWLPASCLATPLLKAPLSFLFSLPARARESRWRLFGPCPAHLSAFARRHSLSPSPKRNRRTAVAPDLASRACARIDLPSLPSLYSPPPLH